MLPEPMPPIPARKGKFVLVTPRHFAVVARKALGFTTAQIAADLQLSPKTVGQYANRARATLHCGTMVEVIWEFHATYSPSLWYGEIIDVRDDEGVNETELAEPNSEDLAQE